MKRTSLIIGLLLFAIAAIPPSFAQGIQTLCLVTSDVAPDSRNAPNIIADIVESIADDFGLDYEIYPANKPGDFEPSINRCIEEGLEVVITVGHTMRNATIEAAAINQDVYLIGLDQQSERKLTNYTGVEFHEDWSAYMAGVLAAQVANQNQINSIGGVIVTHSSERTDRYVIGFENGVLNASEDLNTLIVEISMEDASNELENTIKEMIDDGIGIFFIAHPNPPAGVFEDLARQNIFTISTVPEVWFTEFDAGRKPGSEFFLGSFQNSVELTLYELLEMLAEGNIRDFPGGMVYFSPHLEFTISSERIPESHITDDMRLALETLQAELEAGNIETGIDPVTGKPTE